MPVNSRRKGARAELEFIERHLAAHWPEACRNLNQYGPDKRDVIQCGRIHFQVKRQEHLNIWAALAQAERDVDGIEIPVVAFRRNRSGWYCALAADDLITLLSPRQHR